MVRVETIEEKVERGDAEPRLIPKAFAHFPYDDLPEPYVVKAKPWIPTPSLDDITGSVRTTFDHSQTVGLTCDRLGQRQLDALEHDNRGHHGIAILTIEGKPTAALKLRMHGQPNIISFRYIASKNGTYPLIPGGIYTASADVHEAAERTSRRKPYLAIDDVELYPETMLYDHTCPTTSRRKYGIAEHRFKMILDRESGPRRVWRGFGRAEPRSL